MQFLNFIKNSTFVKTILVIIAFFAGISLFNHLNPWVGVFVLVATALYVISKLPNILKKISGAVPMLLVALTLSMTFASCERVAPNHVGVLMKNYGKDGKADFTIVTGRVSVMEPGTELFQAPLFDQRGEFAESVTLKAADNTQFTARPTYSYKVIKDRAIDVVFDNKQIGGGSDFMRSLEDNILEPRIYDLIKEESRKYSTDSLMATGGSLRFEKSLEVIVESEFEKRGLQLITFSAQIDFDTKVKDKINDRNEVNTNLSVLDQKIEEQKKKNELAKLIAAENKILSSGITPQLLQQQFIEKWDGKSTLYNNPIPVMKVNQ